MKKLYEVLAITTLGAIIGLLLIFMTPAHAGHIHADGQGRFESFELTPNGWHERYTNYAWSLAGHVLSNHATLFVNAGALSNVFNTDNFMFSQYTSNGADYLKLSGLFLATQNPATSFNFSLVLKQPVNSNASTYRTDLYGTMIKDNQTYNQYTSVGDTVATVEPVSVPEPMTMLLLATGLLFVRRLA